MWRVMARVSTSQIPTIPWSMRSSSSSRRERQFEARLAGAWALGALAYALATASRGAQAIGIAAGVLWFGWLVKDYAGEDALVGIAMVLAAGCKRVDLI